MTKFSAKVKTHSTKAGKITRRYVNTVEVSAQEPNLHESEFVNILVEHELVEIADWVTKHELGTRTSFDTWKLKNAEAVTMFLLRWNN